VGKQRRSAKVPEETI